MIPNKPPVRRRHRNKWTDADEQEIVKQSKLIFKQRDLFLIVLAEQGNVLTTQINYDYANPE
jgi:hypothetical protein